MDENKEVFSAELNAKTDFKDAIGGLEKMGKAIKDAISGLKLLNSVSPNTINKILNSSEIKKTSDSVKSLSQEMSQLKTEVLRASSVGAPVSPEAIQKLAHYQNTVKDTKREIDALANEDSINSLKDQFQAVGGTADIADRSLKTMFGDFKDGVALVRGGGNAFVGIQQAMFGLGKSSSTVSKIFSFLGRDLDEVGRANDRLAQAGLRASQQMAQFSSTLSAQSKILKDVAKAELGLPASTFNAIDQQIQRVEKSYKDMQTTIEGGGKPTTHQLARIKAETQLLEQSFIELKSQGVIPAGTATEEMIAKLVQGAGKGRTATAVLAQQMHAMAKAVEEAEQKQTKQGQSATKSIGIFSRLGSIFNIFSRNNHDAANAMNSMAGASGKAVQGVNNLGGALSKVNSFMSIFTGSLTGTFLGNALFAGISGLTNQLGFIKTEFFEANNSVQNFRITMDNMMKGTGLAVDEVQANIEEFIKDVVAKTPFELTDAFDAFQKLLVGGFDPREWLTPVADAAAALNKPMEQLIGAMQKIQVGAKGAGVDMLRDFGIPVNQVGAFVDSSTGKVLAQNEVMNDQRNLYKLSAEELAGLGFEFQKWEFDKQGSLIGDTNQALNLLNGYLSQNAIFAGAAEGRSRSLMGVISNLKDFLTNLLITAGQPIFDRLTSGGQLLLEKLQFLQGPLTSLATTLGTNIAAAMDWAITAVQNFSFSLDALPVPIQNIIAAIQALVGGEWNEAWGYFLTIADDALFSLSDTVNDLIDQAFDWGLGLGEQLGGGIYEAASTILTDALNFIGDTISSFLAPGSPPEKGPLSTIDKWGEPLTKMYTQSLGSGISPKPIIDALDPVAGVLEGDTGPLAGDPFKAQLDRVVDLRSKLAQAKKLGLASASAIQAELTKAEAALKSTNAAASGATGAGTRGGGGDSKQRLSGFKDGGGGAGAGRAAPERAQTLTIEEEYQKQVDLLKEKQKLGLVSEEEYTRELLKIEKDFVEGQLKEGVVSGLDSHIAKINELETKLETFKKTGSSAVSSLSNSFEQITPPTVGDILSGFTDGGEIPSITEAGENIATQLTTKLTEATQTKMADFKEKLGGFFGGLKENITTALGSIGVTPGMLGLGAGLLTLISRFGLLGIGVSGLGGSLLTFLGPVGLVVAAILNWDKIVYGLSETYKFIKDQVDIFTLSMGGQEKAQLAFIKVATESDSIASQFGNTLSQAFSQLTTGDAQGALQTLTSGLGSIDFSGLGNSIIAILGPIGQQVYNAVLAPIVTKITELFAGMSERGTLVGELVNLWNTLGNAFVTFGPPILHTLKQVGIILAVVAGMVINVVISAFTALVDSLPFISSALAGIIRVISGVIGGITGFFQLLQAAWLAVTGDTEQAKVVLETAFSTIGKAIGDVFGGIYQTVSNIGLTILAFVSSFFLNIVGYALTMIPGFEKAGDAIFGFKDYVLGLFGTLSTQAQAIINGLTENVIGFFSYLYDELVGHSIIPDTVTSIITWLTTTLPADLLAALPGMISSLVQGFIGLGTSIVEAIISGITTFGSGGGIGGAIQGVISGIGSSASSLLGGLFSGGEQQEDTQASQAGIAAVTEQTQVALTNLQGIYTAWVASVKAQFSNFFLVVQESLMGIPVVAGESFTFMADALLIMFEVMLETVETEMPKFTSEMVVEMTTMKDKAVRILDELNQKVVKTFDKNDFINIGKAMMDGISKGIDDNKQDVVNKIRDIVNDTVSSAESELGISSPSIRFAELGIQSIQGFEQGVEGQSQSLVQTTRSVFRSMFFKLGRAIDVHARHLDGQVNEWLGEEQGGLVDMFNQFGEDIDPAEIQSATDRLAQIMGRSVQDLRTEFREDYGMSLGDFISQQFDTFTERRNQFIQDNIAKAEAVFSSVDGIVSAFNEAMAQTQSDFYINLDLATALTGMDITEDNLATLFQELQGGASYGVDADAAIIDAFNAQEKLNASLEEQKKIQQEQLKLQEQQNKLDLLKQRLNLIQQGQAAGVDNSILQGLMLGPDAAVSDVLAAMSEVTSAIIAQTEKELGISSPSKVFLGIGKNLTEAVGIGVSQGQRTLLPGIDSFASSVVEAANLGNVLSASMGGTPNISRPNNVPSQSQNVDRSRTLQQTNYINDKLDLAMVTRKMEDAFLNKLG